MTPTEVVARYLERLAARDVDGVAACFDERVVLRGRLRSIVCSTGRVIESRFAIWIGVEGGQINRYRLDEDSYRVAVAAGAA